MDFNSLGAEVVCNMPKLSLRSRPYPNPPTPRELHTISLFEKMRLSKRIWRQPSIQLGRFWISECFLSSLPPACPVSRPAARTAGRPCHRGAASSLPFSPPTPQHLSVETFMCHGVYLWQPPCIYTCMLTHSYHPGGSRFNKYVYRKSGKLPTSFCEILEAC